MKYRSRICYFDKKEFVKTYYLIRKERRYVVFNFDRLCLQNRVKRKAS